MDQLDRLPVELLEKIALDLRNQDFFRITETYDKLNTYGFWKQALREHYGHPPQFGNLNPKEMYIRQFNLYRQISKILKEQEERKMIQLSEDFQPIRRLLADLKNQMDPQFWANQTRYTMADYLGLKAFEIWPDSGPFFLMSTLDSESLLSAAYQQEDLIAMIEVLSRKELPLAAYLELMPVRQIVMTDFWRDLIFLSSLGNPFIDQLLQRGLEIPADYELDDEEVEQLYDRLVEAKIYNISVILLTEKLELDRNTEYEEIMGEIPGQ